MRGKNCADLGAMVEHQCLNSQL